MGVGSKISEGLVRLEDWALEGSPVASFAKTAGLALVGLAGIATVLSAPYRYVYDQNSNEIAEAMARIDRAPLHSVFLSQAACIKEFSITDCADSYARAVEFSKGLGSQMTYKDAAECFNNHGQCVEIVKDVTSTNRVNNMSFLTTGESRSYEPPVVGWQTAGEHLQHSVPLYRGAEQGTLVRKDGQVMTMAPV